MLESTINFRPLGENCLNKTTLIFRSGTFDNIHTEDLFHMKYHLKIKFCIDLRSNEEITGGSNMMGQFNKHIKRINIPILGYYENITQLHNPSPLDYATYYLSILDKNKKNFINFFEFLSHKNHFPLVYNCTAGKDRTGVTSILLLTLLGMSSDEIEYDYVKSSEYILRKIDYFRHDWERKKISPKDYIQRFKCAKEIISIFNDLVAIKYKGYENYLKHIGISNELRLKITELLK